MSAGSRTVVVRRGPRVPDLVATFFSHAAAGFFLLLFVEQDQRTVFRWAMILYWFPLFVMLGMMVLSGARTGTCFAGSDALPETIHVYSQGSFSQILSERVWEWRYFNVATPLLPLRILALFLFGLAIWRSGIPANLPATSAAGKAPSGDLPLACPQTQRWCLDEGTLVSQRYVPSIDSDAQPVLRMRGRPSLSANALAAPAGTVRRGRPAWRSPTIFFRA
jgi:hypothetical protein